MFAENIGASLFGSVRKRGRSQPCSHLEPYEIASPFTDAKDTVVNFVIEYSPRLMWRGVVSKSA